MENDIPSKHNVLDVTTKCPQIKIIFLQGRQQQGATTTDRNRLTFLNLCCHAFVCYPLISLWDLQKKTKTKTGFDLMSRGNPKI